MNVLVRPSRVLAHLLIAVLALALGAAADAGAQSKPKKQPRLSLSVISGEPELVSGGDALVAVDAPTGIGIAKVRVRVNGKDVSKAFSPRPGNARRLVGLVTGLRSGDNRLSARVSAPNASNPAELTLFNTPSEGPLFSGPRQTPFFCTTADAGLSAPTDASSCSAPTQVAYYYRTTGGAFSPLADPTVRPADVAQTTTRSGQTVDYIVRVESGVIDRSIYRWAVLASDGETGRGWNGRFFYTFGGGCSAGHQQGDMPLNAVLQNRELGAGYAVMASSLNRFMTACNDVLSAEAATMIKEHVIEGLGAAPVWTIGQGGSGGSIQIQMIAQNYPGLLDGLIPGASFPDNSPPATPDCRLLTSYFASPDGSSLTPAQRVAIHGLEDPDGCLALNAQADVINAATGCDTPEVPPSQVFNKTTNPGGIRCSIFDSLINIYGTDPATGLVRRTDDNTGVQYGLEALQSGAINLGEFLDLNQAIGGFDDNGDVVPQRSVANTDALRIAYRTGRINQAAGGYPSVPVIDIRDYQDIGLNVHQYIYTFITRARIRATNGTAANQVMWRADGAGTQAMRDAANETMAAWLDSIEADTSSRPLPEKVVAAKPASAVDACWTTVAVRIDDPAEVGATGPCTALYPPHSTPRLEAGQPLSALAMKCALRPVSLADYGSPTPLQQARLAAIFPGGVCDYSQPGVEQQQISGTNQEFGPARVIRQRGRALRLTARVHRDGRRTVATLTARLKPCPATSWQQIVFERKAGKKFRPAGARISNGGNCTATTNLRVGSTLALRATSKFSTGYKGASSKVRRVKPLAPKRRG